MLSNLKVRKTFIVLNDKGLHTRPATELVKCVQNFKAQVDLVYNGLRVNAKSLLGILMLAAARGAEISIEGEGQDAEEAVNAIICLSKHRFNIKY